MKKTIRIKFVDFYPNFHPEKAPLWQRLWDLYHVEHIMLNFPKIRIGWCILFSGQNI